MENIAHTQLKRAKQRVERIKSFYNHVVVFVLINGVLLLLKDEITIAIFGEEGLSIPKLMDWVNWNLYIWMGILTIHALIAFGKRPSFMRKWEARQINKYIEQDKSETYN